MVKIEVVNDNLVIIGLVDCRHDHHYYSIANHFQYSVRFLMTDNFTK